MAVRAWTRSSGGGGDDTYIVDNTGETITEGTSAGTDTVLASATFTLATNVERLTLTGGASINGFGNASANILTGNSGNNLLDGLAGADTLIGGLGDDTYVVDNTGDVVTEQLNEGIDLVQSLVTYTLSQYVENLTLTGTGAVSATGNDLDNVLTGNSAANTLNGGTGADTMSGGGGNDIYVVDSVGDVVFEATAAGTDLVQSSISYVLGADVENLTLTGAASIDGTGNVLGNSLTGNSGNNILDGGAGNDTMTGGAGDDTYILDSTLDAVSEGTSAGTDTILTSVSLTSLATNVENLTLLGTANLTAVGNTLANVMTGNSGDNTLNGGTGADTLIGGAGNDTYVVDNALDVVTEAAGEGTDLVQSGVSHTLAANVENLTLTGSSTGLTATGNELDNILIGNSVANTLNGGAGRDTLDGAGGADTMAGGIGDDIYMVDNTSDATNENAGEGIDQVNSLVARTLAVNLEILFLGGTSAINGTGNSAGNLLRGNSAINTLIGGGGIDILEGGDGADILSNASGNTLMNGGIGNDSLTGSASNDLLIGGVGNDTLNTGTGADLIAFNKGDGLDTVLASTTTDNTVSIGGATTYADLVFQKNGNDLLLKIGASDQITFTGYYTATANRSVSLLQLVLEGSTDYNAGSSDAMFNRKIQTFDFEGLVAAFDSARNADPLLTSWALTNALTAEHLSGSDSAALGGDLAYRYGRFGSLSDVSYTPALGILGDAQFGSAAQALQATGSLQDTSVRLS